MMILYRRFDVKLLVEAPGVSNGKDVDFMESLALETGCGGNSEGMGGGDGGDCGDVGDVAKATAMDCDGKISDPTSNNHKHEDCDVRATIPSNPYKKRNKEPTAPKPKPKQITITKQKTSTNQTTTSNNKLTTNQTTTTQTIQHTPATQPR